MQGLVRNVLSNYPNVLSGEQVRVILHISKRKCAWMLNNGFIKCQNSGKKSRKYAVLKEDLISFIKDYEKHPEKYVTPYAEFSTVKHSHHPNRKTGFPSSLPGNFNDWLEKEFEKLPDALTVPQIIVATGYADNSVDRWIRRGWLKSTQLPTGKIIAKEWLIEFYCGYGYTIAQMSDKHIKLMRKFFKQNK